MMALRCAKRQRAGRWIGRGFGCGVTLAMRVALLAAAFGGLLRFAIAISAMREPQAARFFDDYVAMGREWLDEGYFTRPMYAPGYALLSKWMVCAFGEDGAVRALLALQAAAGAVSCLLVFLVGRAVGLGEWAAAAGAWIYAIDPLGLASCGLVLTEPLYVALMLWGLVVAVRAVDVWRGVGAGLIWAVASLVRGIGLAVAPAVLVFWGVSRRPLGRVVLLVASFLGPVAAGQVLYAAYIYKHYGVFAPGCGGDWKIAASWAGIPRYRAEGRGAEDGVAVWEEDERIRTESNPMVKARLMREAAVEWMIEHPGEVLKGLARSVVGFWGGVFGWAWKAIGLPPGGVRALMGLRLAINVLALIGLVAWLRSGKAREGLVLIVLAIALHELPVGCSGYGRFAVPVAPLVCILAGRGVEWTAEKWKSKGGSEK